jgi:hypothetical protein
MTLYLQCVPHGAFGDSRPKSSRNHYPDYKFTHPETEYSHVYELTIIKRCLEVGGHDSSDRPLA